MVPISRIETISEGVIDFSRVKYVTPTLRDRQKYQLQSGDILFSHINSPEHIGKTALFRSSKPLIHGINLLLLRVNQQVCHPEYLNFYLKSFAVRARFRTRCNKEVRGTFGFVWQGYILASHPNALNHGCKITREQCCSVAGLQFGIGASCTLERKT